MKTKWMPRAYFPPSVAFVPSHKEWARVTKQLTGRAEEYPASAASVSRFESTSGDLCLLVRIDPSSDLDSAEVTGLLVHEAVHVWQMICDYLGEEKPGDELEAYSIQFITQFLLDSYTQTKGEGKQ